MATNWHIVKMKTTVVIPAYKSSTTILRAVNSVLSSTNIEVDVFVIEDGVFDNTQDVLSSLRDRIKIYSFQTNQGAQKARNFGLSLVETPTVLFLDSDDYISSSFLAEMNKKLLDSCAGLAFGNMQIVDENLIPIKAITPKKNETRYEIANRWLRGSPGPHPCGILWLTEVVRKIGGWNEDMTRNQDGEIVIRALSKGIEVVSCRSGKSFYVTHDGNRVSKQMTIDTFDCQSIIVDLVLLWEKYDSIYDFRPALSEFCLYVSLSAYEAGMKRHGDLWFEKSQEIGKINIFYNLRNVKRLIKLLLITFIGPKKSCEISRSIRGNA